MRAIARIVCWNCRKGDKQLFRLKDEYGFKLEDYICVDCKPYHNFPPVANMSKVYLPTPEQIKELKKALKTQQQQITDSGPKAVAIEGDPVVVERHEVLPNVQ